MLTRATIDRVVAAALEEDAPWGDLTSEYLIPENAVATLVKTFGSPDSSGAGSNVSLSSISLASAA